MPIQDIVEKLQRLGLDADEAQVYATLHVAGPSRAGLLAPTAGLSRTQTYRALEALTARGVVTSDTSRPKIFAAAPVEQLLRHLQAQIETHAQELRVLEPELRSALDRKPPAQARDPRGRADFLRTRQVVVARVHQLFESARARLDIVFTHPAGLPLVQDSGGWPILLRRAREGVNVRLIVRALEGNRPFLEEAARVANLSVREVGLEETLVSVIADGADLLAGMIVDPTSYPRADKTLALATDAPNLVALHKAFIEFLWASCGPRSGPDVLPARSVQPVARSPPPAAD